MPPSVSSDRIGFLREAITRIESHGQGAARTFNARNTKRTNHIAMGQTRDVDRLFSSAVAHGALHEIVAASAGDAPAASGFALALAARFATLRNLPVVWILEDHAKAETGAPYAPGLAAHGIDPARLIVVATATGQDSLWAMEEALKCKAVAAVVADIWRLKTYDLAASRRLVLTAQKSGTPGLLVPAGAAGSAAKLSSAAWARFEVRAKPGAHTASAAGRVPLPGHTAWDIRLARIRAGPNLGAFSLDSNRFWPVLWDHEEACFRDAFPIPLSAKARHGPDFTPAPSRAAGAGLWPLAQSA